MSPAVSCGCAVCYPSATIMSTWSATRALSRRAVLVATLLAAVPGLATERRLVADPSQPRRLFVESGGRRQPIPFAAVAITVVNNPKLALAAVFAAPQVVKNAECEYRCTTLHLFDLKSLKHRMLPYGRRWLVFPSEADLWSPDGEYLQIAAVNRRGQPGEGFFASRARKLSFMRAADVRRWIHNGPWRTTSIKRTGTGETGTGDTWMAPIFAKWLPDQRVGFELAGCCDGLSYMVHDLKTGKEWSVRYCEKRDNCTVEGVFRAWRSPHSAKSVVKEPDTK